MGSYLNPGTKGFEESLNSEIYVDKTMLLEHTNAKLNTKQKFLCVSRPRRFGKSMAMDMLSAYYNCGGDSSALFENLKIASAESYKEHLNQYHVIKINMQVFLSMTNPRELAEYFGFTEDEVKALEDYQGNLLLVGINYDKEKKHSCVIEKMMK